MGMMASNRVYHRVAGVVGPILTADRTKPPALLHHYTTPSGLHGILESGGLYLSDARFVNDSSEITYGTQLFLDGLERIAAGQKYREAAKVLDVLKTTLARNRPVVYAGLLTNHFYVVSFCSEGNLLSQWRAYGGPGGGCAIGFDATQLITRAAKSFGALPERVIYRLEEQTELIEHVIEAALGQIAMTPESDKGEATYLAHIFASTVIPSIVTRVKSPCFPKNGNGDSWAGDIRQPT